MSLVEIARGDDVLVYRRETGRWLAFPRESWARHARGEAPGVALALERSRLLADVDPERLVACRHRRVLLLPDRPALWAPDPARPGSGGHAWRALPLDADGLALWRACNDARTLGEAADHARIGRAKARALAHAWTDPAVQALSLRPGPPAAADPGLWLLAGPARPPGPRRDDQHGGDGRTGLSAFHLAIDDAETRFDRAETTVAHALAVGHPALGGAPYGRRLRERLRARGLPVDGPGVEVGCGTGELARDWGAGADWLRVDLSPALLALQARTAPGTRGVLADGTRLPLRRASVRFLLSNEVLADLAAVPSGLADPEVDAFLARAGAAPTPPGSWHNLGAFRLVAEVARVLAPGGAAVLTEFGDPEAAPEETVQLDHPEVGIQFGQLAAVARSVGLAAELVRLDDLLGADLSARQLGRAHWEGVRALAPALPARAWTEEALAGALPEAVEGLRFVPLSQEGPGPLITRFWAVLLRA